VTILDEAASLVDGDRGANYGHPYDDFLKVTQAADALGIDPFRDDPQMAPLHHAGYARTYEMILERT
jgi:hypothetical protein